MAPIAIINDSEILHPTPALSEKPVAGSSSSSTLKTGQNVRVAARSGKFSSQTSGLAPSYLQANLITIPSRYAADFRVLCQRNPVPCPLLAESVDVGRCDALRSHIPGISGEQVAKDLDLRRDFPRYMVYEDGKLLRDQCHDIMDVWTDDHVAFVIGCSFSFETALAGADLVPPHVVHGRNVPMYKTSLPMCAAGVFKGATYVVSMRMYRPTEIEKVRDVTRPYITTHGEPIDWGWDAVRRLGIKDITQPEYGDAPILSDGSLVPQSVDSGAEEYLPVFWGCGVTPQQAVMQAGLQGRVLGHAPGHMLVLDIQDWDILPKSE
jgi:uncharacterized protein YcsI (UPF0317 family)